MRNVYTLQVLSSTITGVFASCSVANLIAGGMTINNAALAFGVLALATASLELPTGFVADKYGRKASSLAGIAISAFAYLVLYSSNAESLSYLAMGILALGSALTSGALEAWFFGNYKRLHPEQKIYDHFFLNLQMCSRGGMITGGFVGPFLMHIDPAYVWLFAAIIGIFALTFGFIRVREERVDNNPTVKTSDESILGGLSSPIILFLGCSFLMGIEGGTRDIVIQPYILDINNGAAYMLSLHQLLCVVFRMSGIITYKQILIHFNQRDRFICLGFALFAISQWIAFQTNNYWVFMPFFCLAIFSFGWLLPLIHSYVNSIVVEKYRATFLSLTNMVETLGQGGICFALAATMTRQSVQHYWLIAAIAAGLAPIFYLMSVSAGSLKVSRPVEIVE